MSVLDELGFADLSVVAPLAGTAPQFVLFLTFLSQAVGGNSDALRSALILQAAFADINIVKG